MSPLAPRAALVALAFALSACNSSDTSVKVKSRVEFTATVDHFTPAGEGPLGIGEPTAR